MVGAITDDSIQHRGGSRRAVNLRAIQRASVPAGPLYVLIDSTGLRSTERANGWNGMIVAQALTDRTLTMRPRSGPLLDQIDGPIGRVSADGAYHRDPTYQIIAAHGDGIEAVIPPRSTAVLSGDADPPTQRDRHLAMITEHGRLA